MSLINKDFRHSPRQGRHPALRWLLFGFGSVVIGAVIASTTNVTRTAETPVSDALIDQTNTPASAENNQDQPAPQSRIARQSFTLPLPELQAQQEILDEINNIAPQKWQEYEVRPGDSLARVFQRAEIKPQQLDEMMHSGEAVKQLRKIYPRDKLRILSDGAGKLQALRYEINHESYLLVERDAQNQLNAGIHNYSIEVRHQYAQGVIESSLFEAAYASGVSENITMELAGIFGWDIDFVLDIRKGDSFTLLYEELYRNGEKIAEGNILAAEFINDEKTYRAVRYQKPGAIRAAYYSPDGASMRKAFLRSPVDFTRISSGFSTGRYHPILHRLRSHKGVDYAAKRGTPVRASGDGKIIYKGVKGGYGRVVIIQHGSKYSTLYAHLNAYDKHIRPGNRVKQGQNIGYVGSSGLATGPHLHYEFRVNGVHRNPLTVALPTAQPVDPDLLADFVQKTTPVLAQLDLLTRTQLALNQ
jgi:murein DD-endopeptidase MepM/ murein hydrolase activator NlpD